MKLAGIAVILVASIATAAPFPETLPQADIDATSDAIRKALPPVDQTAVKKCQVFYDAYNKKPDAPDAVQHVLDGATCFRAAGALSTAIIAFNTTVKYGSAEQKHAALRELGPAFEAAALFDRAATSDEQVASSYANDADANERLQRALCIRRQLGDVMNANRDADAWQRSTKKDPNLACDGLRPIKMP
jgi:lipopolysaccharide biosynthesis regulator YciM